MRGWLAPQMYVFMREFHVDHRSGSTVKWIQGSMSVRMADFRCALPQVTSSRPVDSEPGFAALIRPARSEDSASPSSMSIHTKWGGSENVRHALELLFLMGCQVLEVQHGRLELLCEMRHVEL